jgi:hypothetical protein
MDRPKAIETLEAIRRMMERSARYTALSGWAALAAGVYAIGGAWLTARAAAAGPLAPPGAFFAIWTGVFVLAFATQLVLARGIARRRREAIFSPQARTALAALLPAFAAGVVLGIALARLGRLDRVPAAWMLCYGTGLLSTRPFAPRSIPFLGAAFALGGSALLVLPDPRPWEALAFGFGGLHVVYGALVVRFGHGGDGTPP